MIGATILIVCSTPAVDNSVQVETITPDWPQEVTFTFQVPAAMITTETIVKRHKKKDPKKKDPYITYISRHHSRTSKLMTGYSLVNYWKRIRSSIWQTPSANILPTIQLIFILILIQL